MISLLLLLACGGADSTPAPEPKTEAPKTEAPKTEPPKHAGLFAALPTDMHNGRAVNKAEVDLGRMLYYETRLSKNHDISCNSCHLLDKYGVDNEPTSPGHKGARGGRNSPTSYNAALHLAQFWDGRAADVEAQAKGPILNPVEMAMAGEGEVVAVLKSVPGYGEAFKAAYPKDADPITYDNLANAIGAFERGLVTPGPFDAYLNGDLAALNDEQKKGLDLFVSTGCAACHAGAAVGGAMYQKLGLVNAYETKDVGRMEHTKKESDKFFFKVPSLRNIEKTGPYFHDGSIKTLEEAIQKMAHHQLGKELSGNDVRMIKVFLGSLTGTLPTEYVKKPALPKSGPKTPQADPT